MSTTGLLETLKSDDLNYSMQRTMLNTIKLFDPENL